MRQDLWITAPRGQSSGISVPPVLAVCHNYRHAWIFPDIEKALYSSSVLEKGWSIKSEPRAIHLIDNPWPD